MNASAQWPREPATALIAMMLLGATGSLSLGLAPLIVTALSGAGGLTPAQAGQCISAEMAGSVLGTAITILKAQSFARRGIAIVALLIVISANLICIVASDFTGIITSRFIAGIGCGLTTAAYGMLASSNRPTRNFATYAVFAVLIVALCDVSIPKLIPRYGADSVFALIAFVASLSFAASFRLANEPLSRGIQGSGFSLRGVVNRSVVAGALMTFFYFTALGAFWTYAAQVGTSHGNDPALVATTISIGFLMAGIIGSLLATFLDGRSNALTTIVVCTCSTALFTGAALLLPGPLIFIVAIPAFILAWFTAYPFFMGVLADVDATGRLAMVGVLIQMSGYVIGPLLVGSFVEHGHYVRFALTCLLGYIFTLVCVRALKLTFARPIPLSAQRSS